MSTRKREDGLYWVQTKMGDWTVGKYEHCDPEDVDDWEVIGFQDGFSDEELSAIGEPVVREQPKEETINLVNGSQYSFTKQVGDEMVSYGFGKYDDMTDFIKGSK